MEIPHQGSSKSLGPLLETSARTPPPPRTSEKSLQELFQSRGWLKDSLTNAPPTCRTMFFAVVLSLDSLRVLRYRYTSLNTLLLTRAGVLYNS